jgi:hypothetical protein
MHESVASTDRFREGCTVPQHEDLLAAIGLHTEREGCLIETVPDKIASYVRHDDGCLLNGSATGRAEEEVGIACGVGVDGGILSRPRDGKVWRREIGGLVSVIGPGYVVGGIGWDDVREGGRKKAKALNQRKEGQHLSQDLVWKEDESRMIDEVR